MGRQTPDIVPREARILWGRYAAWVLVPFYLGQKLDPIRSSEERHVPLKNCSKSYHRFMPADSWDGTNLVEEFLKLLIGTRSELDQEVVLACYRMRLFNLVELLEALDQFGELLVLRRD